MVPLTTMNLQARIDRYRERGSSSSKPKSSSSSRRVRRHSSPHSPINSSYLEEPRSCFSTRALDCPETWTCSPPQHRSRDPRNPGCCSFQYPINCRDARPGPTRIPERYREPRLCQAVGPRQSQSPLQHRSNQHRRECLGGPDRQEGNCRRSGKDRRYAKRELSAVSEM